mmetsp:Transcript_16072/g.60802  ORF Transcript_16072/g.60802 Transcript_16072/m.60802 type:complete len:597 (+) Transcript_16072:1159-2949(+)
MSACALRRDGGVREAGCRLARATADQSAEFVGGTGKVNAAPLTTNAPLSPAIPTPHPRAHVRATSGRGRWLGCSGGRTKRRSSGVRLGLLGGGGRGGRGGRGAGGGLGELGPLGVDGLVGEPVGAVVGVGAEEVALSLHEVGGEAGAAVLVQVGERGGERGDGDAAGRGQRDDAAPGVLAGVDLGGELGVDEEVRQVGVAVVRRLDAVEEASADDAAALPDAGALAKVDGPAVLAGGLADDVHALGVGADLGGVEGLADVVDELGAVHSGHVGGAGDDLGGLHALVLEPGEEARLERGGDGARGHGALRCLLHGPAAGALHAGLVEDLVHEVGGLVLAAVVLGLEDLGGDLDQEGLQLALVPLPEGGGQVVVGEPAQRLEHLVRLGDELHVAVLDAVVHHLHVVSGADLPHVRHARAGVRLGRDLGQDGLHAVVCGARASGHEGGPVAGALLAARHAHADEVDLLRREGLGAAHAVREPLVAAVDDEVALLHVLGKQLDARVHRLAGLDEDDHRARLAERLDEIADLVDASEGQVALGLCAGHGGRDLVLGSVAHGDRDPVVRDVESQVLAHDGQAVEADLGLGRVSCCHDLLEPE